MGEVARVVNSIYCFFVYPLFHSLFSSFTVIPTARDMETILWTMYQNYSTKAIFHAPADRGPISHPRVAKETRHTEIVIREKNWSKT